MPKKLIDVLIILITGIISYYVSVSHPEFNNLEMDALWLVIIPIGFALFTLITYLVIAFFFKKFYIKGRWPIVIILGLINLVVGVLVYFNNW